MGTSPTVRRRRLGAELRRLREAANLTHIQVANHLDCSQGKISHIEQGRGPVRTSDVRPLIQLYRADAAKATELMQLAKESKQRGWWQEYADAMPNGFSFFVGMEAEALFIRTFHAMIVPALLQTPAYARTVLTAAQPEVTEAVIE